MARIRKGRMISGVLLLNKPVGMSSNAALQKAKYCYGASKAGHTGSLDPLASGVLPVCFGESTKFSQYLLEATKAYVTRAKLGFKSETGDAEGNLTPIGQPPTLTSELIASILDKFQGELTQTPPMYSALKHNGQPLYKLARDGKKIDVKTRHINIMKLEVLNIVAEDEIEFYVECSKGTYIRSLVEDIGNFLECGAYVNHLERVKSGRFEIAETVSLDELHEIKENNGICALDELLLPTSLLVSEFPALTVRKSHMPQVGKGQALPLDASYVEHLISEGVAVETLPNESVTVKLFTETLEFIGLGLVLSTKIQPKRLISQAAMDKACSR